jgi:hypothetical protein
MVDSVGLRRLERIALLRSIANGCAGDDVCEISDSASFLWLYGSTMIEASVAEDGEIIIHAWLVVGPTKGSHWAHQLARWEGGLSIGELLVDAEGDIVLAHAFPRLTTTERLEQQIYEFCRTADRLDDLIVEQIGGMRSIDRFHRDVIQALTVEALGAHFETRP